MELLIGCGRKRTKSVFLKGQENWTKLVTLDINPSHEPDIAHDLNTLPWPFAGNMFHEVHAYEILEHLGSQGNHEEFFKHFSEIWRILEPNGYLCATVPAWNSIWAWGDPGHTRVINPGTLTFLSQDEYVRQVGKGSPMSDYRFCYKADFRVVHSSMDADTFTFVLQAIKP